MGVTEEIKRMDFEEFREGGYLQEVNRRFFHPLGLALEILVEDGKVVGLGGVWDYRDDPEGMAYGDQMMDETKAAKIDAEWARMEETRVPRLGFMVQPPTQPVHSTTEVANDATSGPNGA